jgi:hypothetical protein
VRVGAGKALPPKTSSLFTKEETMATRISSKTAKPMAKPTAKTTAKSRNPRPAKLPGESVIRHELLGACDIALIPGTQAAIGKKAADALVVALREVYAACTVQCEGYVFNLTLVPLVVLEPDSKTKASKAGS